MALAAMPSPAPAVGATVRAHSLLLARTSSDLAVITAPSAMPATALLVRSTIENDPPTAVPPAPVEDSGKPPLPIMSKTGTSPAKCMVCTWFCAFMTKAGLILCSIRISSSVTPL